MARKASDVSAAREAAREDRAAQRKEVLVKHSPVSYRSEQMSSKAASPAKSRPTGASRGANMG